MRKDPPLVRLGKIEVLQALRRRVYSGPAWITKADILDMIQQHIDALYKPKGGTA